MRKKRKVPVLLLEQLALGELSPLEETRVRKELEGDPEGQAQLARLAQSNQEILAAHPPAVVAARVGSRVEDETRSKRAFYPVWFAAPAAAAVAVVLWVALPDRPPAPAGKSARVSGTSGAQGKAALETTRVKGDPQLLVYRDESDGPAWLESGEQAREGHVLQVKYLAADAPHGVIFSVDGRGAVTLHFPASEVGSTRLKGGGAQILDRAYELDDAPDFERFFFVTGDEEIDIDAVLGAGEELGADPTGMLRLPEELHQCDVLIRKHNGRRKE